MCDVSSLIFMEGKNEGLVEGRAAGIAEGRAEGLAEGWAKGIAEGTAKGKLNVNRASAVRMHAMGLQNSMIAACLDAALEDVRIWISESSFSA